MLSKTEIFFYLNLLLPLVCKSKIKTNTDLELRLLTGDVADQGQFPYEAFITYNNHYKCSGSIIQKHWILTAGHCLRNVKTKPYRLKIHVGTTRFLDEGGQIFDVEDFMSQWDDTIKWPCDSIHDIGLIRINGTIEFNEFAQRISLPDIDFQPVEYVDSWGTVSGWGRIVRESAPSPSDRKLRFTDLQIQSHEDCVSSMCDEPVKDSMYCAAAAGVTTCKGDSGGPFVMGNMQIGIVSGSSCSVGNHIFMVNVAFFVPWIEEQLANYSDSLEDSDNRFEN